MSHTPEVIGWPSQPRSALLIARARPGLRHCMDTKGKIRGGESEGRPDAEGFAP